MLLARRDANLRQRLFKDFDQNVSLRQKKFITKMIITIAIMLSYHAAAGTKTIYTNLYVQ